MLGGAVQGEVQAGRLGMIDNACLEADAFGTDGQVSGIRLQHHGLGPARASRGNPAAALPITPPPMITTSACISASLPDSSPSWQATPHQ
jgi:hypothetical protein